MKYSQARPGRIFVIRLEDGDIVHEKIEAFAKDNEIKAASLIILGGADDKSILTTGPEQGRAETIIPHEHILDNVHEVSGTGTLFPNEKGDPILHMHMACGRGSKSVTGCVKSKVKVWHVMEVIVNELVGSTGVRKKDPVTGFDLLNP
jgi:predicted DNA-binding protein with PD1-like motif